MGAMSKDPADRAEVEELRRRLLSQAPCFDDPAAYAAGIEDALDAVIGLEESERDREQPLVPAGGWFG
jgi:hypothetical protein